MNPLEMYIPNDPVNISHRPINKGMILNLPSNQLPQGALLLAENYIVGEQGPLRRPKLTRYAGGSACLFPPLRFMVVMTKTDGAQQLLAGDKSAVYEVTDKGVTVHPCYHSTGQAAILQDSKTVAGSGTVWSTQAQAGDYFTIETNSSFRPLIEAVVSDTQLTLMNSLTSGYLPGAIQGYSLTMYNIWQSFLYSEPYFVDFTNVDNKVVFADSSRPLFAYDGSSMTTYDASLAFIPTCVTFFRDRLWCGRIVNGSDDYRSRIIWSTITDRTDFDVSGRYVDLPYTQGYVKRLVPFGRTLLAFFGDALYLGRATNIAGDDLPLAFEQINTGGIGLVGMYAVTQWLDGVYFVGQDDIYFISQEGIEAIGTPVVKETIEECENMWAVFAAADPVRSRIIFGFPGEDETIQKLWSYDYKAKAWSYDAIPCEMVYGGIEVESSISWNTLSTALAANTWTGMEIYPSWDSVRAGGAGTKDLFYGRSGKLYKANSAGSTDDDYGAIACTLITPDFDENRPDIVKTNLRVSLKIDRALASDLVFTVYYSNDRGAHYTNAGVLTIAAGDDENFISFLSTGSTFRIKLTSNSQVEQYRINEIVRRVRPRGVEIHLGSTN